MTSNWLTTTSRGGALARVRGDYRYLEEVVRVGFSVRAAKLYLNRHLGNPVSYRLVEVKRGEKTGVVRQITIETSGGGEQVSVSSVRTLPDGSPASYFAPGQLVETRAEVVTSTGGAAPPLQPDDSIVLHVPVRSYLRFLPAIYRGAAPVVHREILKVSPRSARQLGSQNTQVSTAVAGQSGDQFRQFLLMFQHLMTTVVDKIDTIPSLTDPASAPPNFLPWISSWVSFELDESLPLHQQRELVRRSIRLHRTRGTKSGVEEMIRVLTSAPVEVAERVKPKAAVLGQMALAGGSSVSERYQGNEPPASYLVRASRNPTTFFVLNLEARDSFHRRFGERAGAVLRRIQQIVTNEKPSHVTFTIQFDGRFDEQAQVSESSR